VLVLYTCITSGVVDEREVKLEAKLKKTSKSSAVCSTDTLNSITVFVGISFKNALLLAFTEEKNKNNDKRNTTLIFMRGIIIVFSKLQVYFLNHLNI
jgi:hypothetical protein